MCQGLPLQLWPVLEQQQGGWPAYSAKNDGEEEDMEDME